MRSIDLRFFKRSEFVRPAYRKGPDVDWWPHMSLRLLILQDVFRFMWNAPVVISPAAGTVGRYQGPGSESEHNVDRWNEVLGVDVMPEGIRTAADMRRAYELARSIGFTGIGVYPDWRPAPGLHLGVRRDRAPGDPATWGAINDKNGKQQYVGLLQAIETMPADDEEQDHE